MLENKAVEILLIFFSKTWQRMGKSSRYQTVFRNNSKAFIF